MPSLLSFSDSEICPLHFFLGLLCFIKSIESGHPSLLSPLESVLRFCLFFLPLSQCFFNFDPIFHLFDFLSYVIEQKLLQYVLFWFHYVVDALYWFICISNTVIPFDFSSILVDVCVGNYFVFIFVCFSIFSFFYFSFSFSFFCKIDLFWSPITFPFSWPLAQIHLCQFCFCCHQLCLILCFPLCLFPLFCFHFFYFYFYFSSYSKCDLFLSPMTLPINQLTSCLKSSLSILFLLPKTFSFSLFSPLYVSPFFSFFLFLFLPILNVIHSDPFNRPAPCSKSSPSASFLHHFFLCQMFHFPTLIEALYLLFLWEQIFWLFS